MFNLNIFNASQRGNLELLKYFIAVEGIDINSKDDSPFEVENKLLLFISFHFFFLFY